jgi:hypothetical protein
MGVGKVANDRKWSWTAAIEVCFPFNFPVVFDFMYFRFRPCKAKSIGNVLPNRQNAAYKVKEELRIKDGYTLRCAIILTQQCILRQ